MHQAHAAARMGGDDPGRPWLAQRPDVVDDVRPQVQHRLHDLGLVGVDRDWHPQAHRLHHQRHDARQLLLQRHRRATRARGFTADVQDIRAILDQLLAVPQRSPRINMPAAV